MTHARACPLAVVGTTLAWFPLIATVGTAIAGSLRRGWFRVDYLMPAELGLFALAGGVLLLLVALWARRRRSLIGGSIAVAVAVLAGSMWLATITGLASGDTEPGGWASALVAAGLAVYTLAVAALGIGGVLLVRDLCRRSGPAA